MLRKDLLNLRNWSQSINNPSKKQIAMEMNLSEIQSREILPGYHGKLIHSEKMTLVFWDVEAGAVVPEHAHMHEQILHVLHGKFEFTVGGATRVYQADDIVVIPGHTPHGGRAITKCRLMDVFCPVREAYKHD